MKLRVPPLVAAAWMLMLMMAAIAALSPARALDVCTLIVAPTTTTQACIANRCWPSADGSKSICFGQHPCCCPQTSDPPSFNCRRPDGSTYTWVGNLPLPP